MGNETGSPFSLRYRSGRSEERRRRSGVAAGVGVGRIRESGDEFVAGGGRNGEGFDDLLLQGATARNGAERRIETSAAANTEDQKPAASILLGGLHSVGGMGRSRRPTLRPQEIFPKACEIVSTAATLCH